MGRLSVEMGETKMSNETISYADFCERALDINPNWHAELSDEHRDEILTLAWQECAWISTLTDERIIRAIANARELEMINIYDNGKPHIARYYFEIIGWRWGVWANRFLFLDGKPPTLRSSKFCTICYSWHHL